MKKTWRWFGKNDAITLDMLRQIGVEGIVTSLYDIPPGEVWPLSAILELKSYMEKAGLPWSVVESLPVAEEIKYGGKDRAAMVENYKKSLAHLGKAGIKTVCYNFMPAIDWVRTNLNWKLPNGASTLYFDKIRFAYFDCRILEREEAEMDFSPEEREKVEALDKVITEEEKADLIDTIIVKTQNFIHRGIVSSRSTPLEAFRQLLAKYREIDKDRLRENLLCFLEQVIPVAEEQGIQLCIHPDDPPFPVFGLPRIVTGEEDISWILRAVESPSNRLTFCAGSLSAGSNNDVPALARLFAGEVGFAHLRSTELLPNGDFVEASHLEGGGKLIEVIRALEKANPRIPMRVDHGALMLDDANKGYNPGYSFHGRMFALAQVEGMMAVVKDEINRALNVE